MNASYITNGCLIDKTADVYIIAIKDDAISDYSKLIQIDGKDGMLFYKRGLLYQQLGKKKEAERDFSQAKALGVKVENENINSIKTTEEKRSKIICVKYTE